MSSSFRRIRRILIFALVALLVVMINVLAAKIVARYNLKLDLTASRLYSISDETKERIRGLDREVKLLVICQGRDAITEYAEMLDRYDACSELLSVEYVNPDTDLLLIDRYQEDGVEIAMNSIIVECGTKRRVVRFSDMYAFSADGSLTMFEGESKVTSAIMTVVRDDHVKAVLVMGHGEDTPAVLQSQLVKGGCEVAGFVLNKDVPEEVGCVILAGPKNDYSAKEIEYLEDYLNRGGTLLYFKDAGVKELEKLDALLDEWGIRFAYQAVMDASYNIESNPMYVVAQFVQHEINKYFETHSYYVVTPVTAPILEDFENPSGAEVSVVLGSSDRAYARDVDNQSADRSLNKQDTDTEGPFVLAAVSEKTVTAKDGSVSTGRIFAMGTRRFYTDELLQSSSVGNSAYMSELVNWAAGSSDAVVSIPGKQVGDEPILVTSDQIRLFSILLIGVIPAVIIGAGIVMVIRRRYL